MTVETARPATDPKSAGALNRVIRLASRTGEVRAVLEDDFHHFRVMLHHDGDRVTAIDADSPRHPYSLCPAAGLHLRALIGLELSDDVTAPMRRTDARQHCTHQLDLAGLAYTAAARGTRTLQYHMVVTDPLDGLSVATLACEGRETLRWIVRGDQIEADAPFGIRSWGAGFTQWASTTLDPTLREQALALRRAVFIGRGRPSIPLLDARATAPVTGGCWVQQPEQAGEAMRMIGSSRDYTHCAEMLTAGDDVWLAFGSDS